MHAARVPGNVRQGCGVVSEFGAVRLRWDRRGGVGASGGSKLESRAVGGQGGVVDIGRRGVGQTWPAPVRAKKSFFFHDATKSGSHRPGSAPASQPGWPSLGISLLELDLT